VADAPTEALPVAASNDQAAEEAAESDAGEESGVRRGWWQRTFG